MLITVSGPNSGMKSSSSIFKEPTSETLSELLSNPNRFRGVNLNTTTAEEREQDVIWVQNFALALLSRLEERFPTDELNILKALEILNPAKMHVVLPNDYGKSEVEEIIEHFGAPMEGHPV